MTIRISPGVVSILNFYGRFAAAYGTCWLAAMLLSLVTQSRIDIGVFGLIGFPLISLFYALCVRFIQPGGDTQRGFDVMQPK